MKALVYRGPFDLAMEEREEPTPRANEVKVRPVYVGICGSDVHGYTGKTGRRTAPMIMGHEIAARVESTGSAVARFRKGDRVTIQPIMYCGECPYCRQGMQNVCANRRGLGVLDVDGAFTEYLCMPEQNVFPIPDNVPDRVAALIEPFSVVYRAMRYAMPISGKNVLIIGAGTIGMLFLKLAKSFGAATVVVSDLSAERLAAAKRLGADLVVNPKEAVLTEWLDANGLNDRIDVSVECVGASVTAAQSIECVRINGLALWIGNAAKTAQIDMQSVVTRSVRVQGTYGFAEADFKDALAYLSTGNIDLSELVTGIVPLEQAAEAFDKLYRDPGTDLKVLVQIGEPV